MNNLRSGIGSTPVASGTRPTTSEPSRPTGKVESYLKGILLLGGEPEGQLVPTGRLSSELGLAAGTVSEMIKTLDKEGLVGYAPYSGARLTPAGYQLATQALRRHRLIKLFLVEVMRFDWSEVQAEAESLEHSVSDRLVERIDEMLRQPTVDPHGDPIPSPGGELETEECEDLLSCPLDQPQKVIRIRDLSPSFLLVAEKFCLTPGSTVTVESRDQTADALVLHTESYQEPVTLGFQAGTKIYVREL